MRWSKINAVHGNRLNAESNYVFQCKAGKLIRYKLGAPAM